MAASQSNSIPVRCPKCGSRFAVGAALIGREGRCQCGHVFRLARATEGAQPSGSPPIPSSGARYIGVSCRVCGTRMFGRPEDVGRLLKCPDCHALTALPQPPPPPVHAHLTALEGEQYELWDADTGPPLAAIIAAQPKYIAVDCRLCQTRMYALPEQVGKQLKCPDCGTPNTVPPPPDVKPHESPIHLEDAYELDESAPPTAPPPVSVPSRRPMLYEEERDAELARQVRSRRRGRGPKYDLKGRPVMPRWPLVTRVLPFLFSRGVPARWAMLSVGLFVVLAVLGTGVSTIRPTGGIQATGIAVIGGVCLFLFAVVTGVLWFSALASTVETIVTESSEGNDYVQQWPAPNPADWLGPMLTLGIAAMISAFPGWLVVQFASAIPNFSAGELLAEHWELRAAVIGASMMLFLPLVYLSQLEIGSMFGVLSGRVAASLLKCPLSWMFFYVEMAVIAVLCVAARVAASEFGAAIVLIQVPLAVVAALIGARLLGRLAWKLAEAMAEDESSGQDGQAP